MIKTMGEQISLIVEKIADLAGISEELLDRIIDLEKRINKLENKGGKNE